MILGMGVSGPVIEKDGLAIKTIKLEIQDLENKYNLNNYKNISFPPPRNCDIPDPKYFIDNQPFIPGINPWRELFILQKLKDCNIKGVIKYSKHEIVNNSLIIYTEVAGYTTFYDWLKSSSFSKEKLTNIVSKIENIISELSKLNIIHMDLKPKNIILNKDLEPIILDFGWSMIDTFPMCNDELKYFEQNKNFDISNLKLRLKYL